MPQGRGGDRFRTRSPRPGSAPAAGRGLPEALRREGCGQAFPKDVAGTGNHYESGLFAMGHVRAFNAAAQGACSSRGGGGASWPQCVQPGGLFSLGTGTATCMAAWALLASLWPQPCWRCSGGCGVSTRTHVPRPHPQWAGEVCAPSPPHPTPRRGRSYWCSGRNVRLRTREAVGTISTSWDEGGDVGPPPRWDLDG